MKIIYFIRLLISFFNRLKPKHRKLILIFLDILILSISILISVSINFDFIYFDELVNYLWIIPISLIISIPLYAFTGQYRSLARFGVGSSGYKIFIRNIGLVIIISLIGSRLNYINLSLYNYLLLVLVISFLYYVFNP